MKKIILAASIVVVLGCNHSFAQKADGITSAATSRFNQEFPQATSISWEKANRNLFLARFKMEEGNWIAFIDPAGQLVSTGKLIPFKQAPMRLQGRVEKIKLSYEKTYGELAIMHVYELVENDNTRYFINVGNKNLYVALLSEGNNDIRTLRKSELKQTAGVDSKILARE